MPIFEIACFILEMLRFVLFRDLLFDDEKFCRSVTQAVADSLI